MESSEQSAVDGSLEQDNLSSAAEGIAGASYEDYDGEVLVLNQGEGEEEQVGGCLDEENPTVFLQSQGLELNGKRLILVEGSGGEILIYESIDHDTYIKLSLEQSEHSDDNHTLATASGSNNLEDVCEGIEKIQLNEANAEALGGTVFHVQEKDTTEMVPTTSQIISTGNNTRLHLADVANSECATSELHKKEENGCVRKINVESVIVNQICAYPDPDSDSSKEEGVSMSAVNEQDNKNSFQDEHMVPEIETSSPAGEDKSILSVLP